MLEEQAVITRVEGHTVFISSLQTGACSQCAQKQSCSTTLYAKWLPKRELSLSSSLELKAGDKVVVGIDETHLLKASLFMYLVPLAIMLGVAALFAGAGQNAALPAFIALFAGFYLIHRLQHFFIHYFMAPPQIVRIL